jgi:drug/metabolite transporter (DMT)-like permease
MTKKHKAVAAVIACVLFWGFSFISIKITVAVLPPMTLGAFRFALAVIILFFIKRKIAPKEKLIKKDIPLLAGAGITGVTLYFFFENNGVSLIPASEASIFVGAIPVITMISEAAWARISFSQNKDRNKKLKKGDLNIEEKIPVNGNEKRQSLFFKTILPGIGALISLAGVALVAGVSFALSGTALGYIFMSGACVSWVVYCFLTRSLFISHSRIFIVFWQSLFGFIGFLPFTLFESSWQMPGLEVWGHLLFLGLFCSALGYWFYAMALEDLGVGQATIFINLIPVVSVLGAFFILGERLKPLQWFGAALVLAGVYLTMLAPGKDGLVND